MSVNFLLLRQCFFVYLCGLLTSLKIQLKLEKLEHELFYGTQAILTSLGHTHIQAYLQPCRENVVWYAKILVQVRYFEYEVISWVLVRHGSSLVEEKIIFALISLCGEAELPHF